MDRPVLQKIHEATPIRHHNDHIQPSSSCSTTSSPFDSSLSNATVALFPVVSLEPPAFYARLSLALLKFEEGFSNYSIR